MQSTEPEMRHFLKITPCNKASHFSILTKNTKLVNMNVLNFNPGFKGLYHSPFSKGRIEIYRKGSRKTGGQIRHGSLTLYLLTWRIWWAPSNASKGQMGFNSAFKGLMLHQCKQWHLLTNGGITSGTEVIRCYMHDTLQSLHLWSVTYFSIFQKNDTHSLPKRTESDTSKHGYKDTSKLRDFTLRRKWLLKSVWH